MFALVDCNNFYASCERLFDPSLNGKPIVVLSNNDGCIIARSAEAKLLGIPMGAPWFKLEDMARQHGIIAKSSNYALYANMSNRVVEVLRGFTPNLEVYSIDESFLELSGFGHLDLTDYGQQIRHRVANWVGLPVGVGIAPTKTLAKLANHYAKKRPVFNGVCNLAVLSCEEQMQLFKETPVEEVWGVGRRLTGRLQQMGINTVEALRWADIQLIRRVFGVVLERTVRELRGILCIEMEEAAPDKQQIICSRSFGQPITRLADMNEALASYIARAAVKLRYQQSVAATLTVWLETNPFKPVPQYSRSMTIPFPSASDDTLQLTRVGLWMMDKIFREGFEYKKCGCMLAAISPKGQTQGDLFTQGSSMHGKAIAALDAINAKFGRGAIKSAAEGIKTPWQMQRRMMSPAYTTHWSELMRVR